MIDFENKRIQIPQGSNLNGAQILQLVEQEIRDNYWKDGKLLEGLEHPYEIRTVKIGGNAGNEPINVGNSAILLQRIQIRENWIITDQPLPEEKTEE